MKRNVVILALFLTAGTILRAQSTLPIQAKGMWFWHLWSANNGDLNAVIGKLKSVGVTWIVAKMGDSDSYYNGSGKSLYTWAAGYGGMDSVVSIFHNNGIKILGYQYVYGANHWGSGPSEADVANMILDVKGIDGLLIDAEIEYDNLSNGSVVATAYMDSIRAHHPSAFVGLTSWAYITYHTTFPWVSFLTRVEVNMPQTYWAARPKTPASELTKMAGDYASYAVTWVNQGYPAAIKPIMPLGQGEYFGYGSDVQAGDITSFSNLCQTTYDYQGISLWEYSQITNSYVWDEYANAWPVTAVTNKDERPMRYELSQNFPNPFNPSTTIQYSVASAGTVSLEVFDVLGQEVATLVKGRKNAGRYTVEWNAGDFPSGIYFCRLQAGSFVTTKKLMLLK